MGKEIRRFLITGFWVTCVLGTVLHFVYGWSGQNPVVGLFAPVSESTWEHLKLLFFPAFFWAILGRLFLKDRGESILPAFAAGICAGMLFIVSFFYTYSGILGRNWLPMDMLTFFLGVLTTFRTAGRKLQKDEGSGKTPEKSAVFLLVLLALSFFLFTYRTPPLGLFLVG